ncbi:hypothetical protein BC936DRAFT_143040 [Jimgerdemannia flammicorona]|uniref:Uncharacterized protein n=1 Tax=Jimgerdemannia flammicorona TaxID=994334 RepID=A0A433DED9_9FUNG|nr:hypothetical protein BC936DRAFT_143040 [Jimgerdemannia flammicorona]
MVMVFRLPSLLRFSLTSTPSATVKVCADPIHAKPTDITPPTTEPTVEVIKRTSTIMNDVAAAKSAATAVVPSNVEKKQLAKASTTASLPSIWSLLKLAGLSKSTPVAAADTKIASPRMNILDLVVPIVAIIFVQVVAAETKAFGSTYGTNAHAIPKGFAQRLLRPNGTASAADNKGYDPTFPGSLDSGFAEVDETIWQANKPVPNPADPEDEVYDNEDYDNEYDEENDEENDNRPSNEELLKLALEVMNYVGTAAVTDEMKSLQLKLGDYLGIPPEENKDEIRFGSMEMTSTETDVDGQAS